MNFLVNHIILPEIFNLITSRTHWTMTSYVKAELYDKIKKSIYQLTDGKDIRSSSEPGKISYLRNNIRLKLTTRRFLTRILKLNLPISECIDIAYQPDYLTVEEKETIKNGKLSDVELESLATAIALRLSIRPTFQLLKGDEIGEAYDFEVGGSSCMTGTSQYVGLYCDNPKKVRLAVCKINKESARTIVWVTDKGIIHDRLYSNSELAKKLLSEKLESYGIPNVYANKIKDVKVTGLRYEDGRVPFLDSLFRGTVEWDGTLTLSDSVGTITLQNQNGYIVEGGHCAECGIFYPDSDLTWMEIGDGYYCDECLDYLFVFCRHCGEGQDQDSVFMGLDDNPYCDSCYRELYENCYDCGETIFRDNARTGPDGYDYCEDCFHEYFILCDNCGDYFDKDDVKKGPWDSINKECEYCEDCFDKLYIVCDNCGQYFDSEDIKDGSDNSKYCEDCYIERFAVKKE